MTFIYSIPVHWIWNEDGWLRFTEFELQNDKENKFKTRDFAGAGLVHLVSLTSNFKKIHLEVKKKGQNLVNVFFERTLF